MKYLLDSNTLIAVALGVNEGLRAKVAASDADDLVTSAIAYAEIVHGSAKGLPPPMEKLALLIEEVPVLPFDEKAGLAYATLPFKRASYDRLIAAHALSLGLIVVTDNEADFADVPGLVVENWTV